jgi:hypothetical protein
MTDGSVETVTVSAPARLGEIRLGEDAGRIT